MLSMQPESVIRDAGVVTVTGEAVIRAEPDEAVLWITLSALETAPGAALADVARRSEALVALLDELQVADADRSTSGITVYEEFDHTQQGRRSLGHRAAAALSARLTDPVLIGRLITRVTEELQARIDGPSWQIAESDPVRLQAAREAAAQAERKARAYAEGVGARLGPLLKLAEPEDRFVRRSGGGLRPMAASRDSSMPIEPGEHEVSAAVVATFALEPTRH
jgi:uncharacterized protein